MPPRKKTQAGPPPLTDDDVAALKSRVGAGEKPRILVRSASAAVPAGTRGNIIRVGNPADGEYIVVRLGRDEVPFAPNELALTTRSLAATTRSKAAAPAPAPARTTTKTSRKTARQATKKPATRKTATPPRAAAKSAAPAAAARTSPPAAKTTTPAVAKTTTPAATKKPVAPRRKAAGRRPGHPLTVTLRFANDAWTVEAQRGARRLAKASPLRPGAVKAFADLVDDPQVRDALSETVASSRAVVEQRAEKLRAELEAAEAALQEYEARRR